MTDPAIDRLLREAIRHTGRRPEESAGRDVWKNFAEALSREIAQAFADALRRDFKAVLPSASGKGRESKSSGAKGMKRLDVNYSTATHGLGLGVSIKTINKRDPRSRNYRKNFTRVDAELRAEATDYHRRQPYAVLAAVIFMPWDACEDGTGEEPSNFGRAIKWFYSRNHRKGPDDEADKFEQVYVALYRPSGDQAGESVFFDVREPPPRQGPPKFGRSLTFNDVIVRLREAYWERNRPPFLFDDGRP